MAANLVIVESPAKAKTINKILGRDFVVKASMGHVRDLPVNNLGVDVDNGFAPKYVNVKGRNKVLAELKQAAAQATTIYLAPDPDREGEAIAWHLREVLSNRKGERKFLRVQYNEITPRAVREAFDHPGDLNMSRVEAQQARRILDRIVGYKVSPILWRRIRRGLSAGRVQSVALRLVCEREREIQGFVPEAFWLIGARVRKHVDPLTPFWARLVRIDGEKATIKSAEVTDEVLADLKTRALRVADVATRSIRKRPYPPFITSSLQQAASNVCGFSPARTMSIAQRLYEGVDLGEGPVGLITYMRTDSFAIAVEASQACREFVLQQYGPRFVPATPNVYKRGGVVQGAHEAIRPTDVRRTPESLRDALEKPEWRVYELIWKRFVASQMAPAEIDQRTVRIEAVPGPETRGTREYGLQASASLVTFAGYMEVAGTEIRKRDDENPDDQSTLPPLDKGEGLECVEWKQERKETQPPNRFSEASLVKALESNGVGRPSTFASIVGTLYDRDYVQKEKQSLVPTELGFQVCDILVKDLGSLFDVGFTAKMEESLDRVENGEMSWTGMLQEFYSRFTGWLAGIHVPTADSQAVDAMLAALGHVSEWQPETKRGKRTYSDAGFVTSIRQQLSEGKALSEKQLKALVRLAAQYRKQIPGVEAILEQFGFSDMLANATDDVAHGSSLDKLAVLASVELNDSAKRFVDSLRQQLERGRRLSAAQIRALERILLSHGSRIPDFEAVKARFGLVAEAPTGQPDEVSGRLLEAMRQVREWKPARTRGKRVFDDKKFYESLVDYYGQRQALTDRQQAALKKMLGRYRDQVPEAAQLLARPEPEGEATRGTGT